MPRRTRSLVTACLFPVLTAAAAGALAPPVASGVTARPETVPAAATLTPSAQAQAVYNRMSSAQRIGQLFMVGGSATGVGTATATAITRYHVGNLILMGRATTGAADVRYLTGRAQTLTTTAATAGVPLFVSADQEGGQVQVLQGPGFSRMPTALTQGTWADPTLTASARTWGTQVLRSGVNVDLAPVMDTVAKGFAASNRPIGFYQREFGYTPAAVADKGTAFLRGMQASGLAMTPKHFPGLGRVTGNTDTTAGVTDTVTTRTSADLVPFKAAVTAGARFLMVSSAYYSRIDRSHPAVFSSTVIGGMIRHDLGFTGVVISDDLGAARQVAAWSPGARAVNFINAGGDMVLTGNAPGIPAMVAAVTSRAASDSAFRSRVQAAVMRVLTVKAEYGLLAPRLPVTGSLDVRTKTALQRWLGVAQTGVFDTATVRALQTRTGAPVTGSWGARSAAALQDYLGLYRDGVSTWNARTVAGLQRYLVTQL
ncbi:glycoside hydrolase family 3 N-terminal domain-containing protein [Terrabacter sp. NPDC080008]|uniref:glycoside hydrolase family 3 N-terminal domain-containing protein n=1 Tax=Terrabacter sp. NPDC080008 TaxID=3155176 RepID=UPI00344D31EB